MESLEIYIPMDRRQAMARGQDLPDRTTGAALFADIHGFTPLTEALVQELGPKRAAEVVTRQLNRVYDVLIAEVHRYGGSVIGFSGDSITCWLDGDNGRRATACGLALQQAITQFEVVPTPAGTSITLGIKVAVTAGQALRFLVGYPRIQTMEVLAGSILYRMVAAEGQLRQGEVVVGSEVMGRLGNQAMVQEWRADPSGEHFAVVTGLTEPVPPAPWPEVPGLSADIARDWLLPPVFQRLQRGEGEFLAELRPAVPLLLKFSGIDYDQDDEAGAKLDAYIRWVQTVLARYGGYLIQLTIGDKGSFLYAAFGAPLAHDDDPARAVAAAVDLRMPPAALDFIGGVQIGLSRGQMRTGAYGSSRRRTYGVIGNEVNIASRLMGQAEPGQILVSGRIAWAAAHCYDFQELEPVPLKGLAAPLPIFAVRGKRHERTARTLKGLRLAPMVGRTAERAALAEQLQSLLDGRGGSVVIEGEAGIGKSRLAVDLMEQSRALGVPTLLGAGDAIEQATAYHAWRPVFRALFGLGEMEDAAAAREQVLAQLEDDPYLRERVPLLNAVLPLNVPDRSTLIFNKLNVPDSDLTAQMTGELRASNTRDLLVRVLARAPRTLSALLLVLEDAHWLDSASWALMAQVKREVPSLLLVVVTRPMVEGIAGAPLPDEYKRLLAAPDTQHIQLKTLPPEEMLTLVCRRLGVTRLPTPVENLIRQRAEGHPFFSEEIAYALRDAGLIHVTDGQCRLAAEAGDMRDLGFPDTIQGVITSRIDHLTPEQQLTLKVASVIGRIFPFCTLRDIHPVEADKPHLVDYLTALARLDITPVETPEPDLAYIFKHVITQEVAYSLLLYAQRQQLHRAVAEWLEQAYADDLAPYYPLLAHHWGKAAEIAHAEPVLVLKTIDYLEKAGEQALQDGAYREAVNFLSQAVSLAEEWEGKGAAERDGRISPLLLAPQRLAYWQRLLGEAHHGLGQPVEGRKHLQRALGLLGQPVPTTTRALVIGLVGQVLRHIWHWFWPAKLRKPSPGVRASLLEASQAYERLAQLHWLANEALPTLYTALHGFNLAERAGPSPELTRFYSNIDGFYRFFQLHRLAEVYRRRARETAQDLDDLPALARVLLMTGMWSLGFDQWTEVKDTLEQAVVLYKRLGDKRGWGDSLCTLGWALYFQARFTAGVEIFVDLYTLGADSDNPEHQAWGLNGQAMSLLRLGQTDQAVTLLETALPLLTVIAQSRVGEILNHGLMAVARLRQGQVQAALQAAETVARLIGQSLPIAFGLFDGYAGAIEVYLALWEEAISGGTQAEARTLRSAAREACKALRRFAWRHPIGQPRAWLCQGLFDWLAGKRRRAHRAWRKSLAHAVKLAMPYEEGLAHYEIGRHLSPDAPARQEHLSRAMAIFTQLEAAYDLAWAQAALAGQ